MSAFSTGDILGNRIDFEIARDGFVRTLQGGAALRKAEEWLLSQGYRLIQLDAGSWRSDQHMHTAFAAALRFPSYFGKNLDALNDCMSDVAEAEYGWDVSDVGVVLVLADFDRFAARLPRTADRLEAILRAQGRYAALFGNRLLTILSARASMTGAES